METWYTQLEHHLNLVASLTVLGFVFAQHKVWTRMKDRLNTLWFHHCADKGENYVPLENGKR